MPTVLIVAPSPVLRAGLRALLGETATPVAGEIATLEGLARDAGPFDVLLLADERGLADIEPLLADEEGAFALVLLSDEASAAATLRALPVRGWALLPYDVSAGELHAAISAAAQGLVVLTPPLAARLVPSREPGAEPLVEPLTGREAEVLALLGQGLPNKLIARQLGISEHTVKFHISSIFSKLGASSRTDAVSRGARQGLIVL